MEKTPLWQKNWFIMLMFFVVPPVGIVLMWYGKKEWNKVIKVVLSVIFGLYFFLWSLILLGTADDDTSTSAPAETTAYSELTEEHTTLNFITPTREESTTEATTEKEEPTTVVSTTKESTTNSTVVTKPVATTKKVTTTAKATTTKAPTTAKPTTTKAPATQSASTEYVLNNNTMKFHYPSCSSVKKISPENKGTFKGDRQSLLNRGYEPCGNCHP